MTVTCLTCGLRYDDVYRLTYCPHERFEMRTLATNAAGETRLCTTLEQLHEHMQEAP